MGSQEIIRRAAQSTGRKKQFEAAALNTQAAIQAPRLLTSELLLGLMGRAHRSSGGLGNMR